MKHEPLQLSVEERQPGDFLWVLMQTDARGRPERITRRAEAPYASYEAALAAGTRALNAQLHRAEPAHA
ncbi:MAG: hypothetical protein EOO29_00070 [Comamonadaceae bacterium]|nr:MAG: hypothetical protein EOO29_00070 [Comamonadaceae bacterium]